ncbi:hypothetical protein Thal_1296 [Thermocrinis albus DSM 14484]|uniref:N-acetyltransferase domain-containing protein n=1 Tax=Thermocrinis albus (strain DSM 14484 / JCM 11386 / HI 11/12) TaxID=638303 RepID=D3SME7_THEAH|nr:hypothetical protein [Thermocrinis albus]ADC89927.1 hypothetical protein Thal_1296 [Thermocrinis albus DSM 14484]
MQVKDARDFNVFYVIKNIERKSWKTQSELRFEDFKTENKRGFLFLQDTGEVVGYVVYSYRKRRIYVEDLVILNPLFLPRVMRMLDKFFAPADIVALVEENFVWFFSDRILRHGSYRLQIARKFRILGNNFTYIRLCHEDSSRRR